MDNKNLNKSIATISKSIKDKDAVLEYQKAMKDATKNLNKKVGVKK